jgi:protocatechuate 3,4-dioxygenase beta subunit
MDRRTILLGAGALTLSSVPILTGACAQQRPAASGGGPLITGESCPVTPAQTEGPFYFDPRLLRSEIAEEKPGIPLRLRVQIVESGRCDPLKGSRVDLWHCDSAGVYSGYESERSTGETFLRGTQMADAQGLVSFATIYPGWYGGRATHIHCKARTSDGRELATQFYFPDTLSELIHKESAYARRGSDWRLTNREDRIFRSAGAGEATMIEIKRTPSGYDGAIVLTLA